MIAFLAALLLAQGVSKAELKEKLKDVDVAGDWVYDDLPAGFARAKSEAKPLMVVFRCVPCVSFKLIDRQVAKREDPALAALMEKFVCVRMVQAWQLDLAKYSFDPDLNWVVFLMNADGSIYGRYGTKPKKGNVQALVSVEGLRKAMEGALELHAKPPASLKAKTAPGSAWKTPDAIPSLQGKPFMRPADGSRAGCVHCHWLHEGEVWSRRATGKPLPDRELWAWPLPDSVGLNLDPAERATVTSLLPGSAAEKSGFKPGDRLLSMEGQPLLSIADVQWVLQHAPDEGSIAVEVARGGATSKLTLPLAAGWRHAAEFSWRTITWGLRHKMLGVEPLQQMSAADRESAGLKDGEMALQMKKLPPAWVKEKSPGGAQFKPGDAIVEVDGRKDLVREDDLFAHLLSKKPGTKVDVVVLRGGSREKLAFTLP